MVARGSCTILIVRPGSAMNSGRSKYGEMSCDLVVQSVFSHLLSQCNLIRDTADRSMGCGPSGELVVEEAVSTGSGEILSPG